MTSVNTSQLGTKPPRYRRRKWVIRSAFQWKYAAIIMAGTFLTCVFLSLFLFGILHHQARSRTLLEPTTTTGEIVMVVVGAALAFSLAPMLAFGLWSIVATHRICGPIYVVEQYCKDIIGGPVRGWDGQNVGHQPIYGLVYRFMHVVRIRCR